jgi:transcriptional regulator with XRE-family HTH domain
MPPVPRGEEQAQAQALGEQVRRYRQERGYSLSELARRADLAKSYISSIEHDQAPRPSGRTLYAIAEALGVTMSDLLGRRLLSQATTDRPVSLEAFAAEHDLPEADIQMLASINFRGEQPLTKQRWAHIYSAIRGTEWMDQSNSDETKS